MEENSSVLPGDFRPVKWDQPFSESDNVLILTNDMFVECIKSHKNSPVPDNITPMVIKILFG